jgi:hypothetical protein
VHILELINQRINAAACNGKSEVLTSLIELKSAIDAAPADDKEATIRMLARQLTQWTSRAQAFEANYNQMLKRIDAIRKSVAEETK